MAEADTRLSEWSRKHDVNEVGGNGITLLASSIANVRKNGLYEHSTACISNRVRLPLQYHPKKSHR